MENQIQVRDYKLWQLNSLEIFPMRKNVNNTPWWYKIDQSKLPLNSVIKMLIIMENSAVLSYSI